MKPEGRDWLTATLNVSRETLDRLAAYEAMVIAAQASQNLVSAATIPDFWNRHIVDSAQLILFAGIDAADRIWLDIGSGAGLPGIVTAIITGAKTILVEPRQKRAAFLSDVVSGLKLVNCSVECRNLQRVAPFEAGVITARALAPLPEILKMALPFSRGGTVWLLPKGKNAKAELASLDSAWQGVFETRTSVTNPESAIIVGRKIRRSGRA